MHKSYIATQSHWHQWPVLYRKRYLSSSKRLLDLFARTLLNPQLLSTHFGSRNESSSSIYCSYLHSTKYHGWALECTFSWICGESGVEYSSDKHAGLVTQLEMTLVKPNMSFVHTTLVGILAHYMLSMSLWTNSICQLILNPTTTSFEMRA